MHLCILPNKISPTDQTLIPVGYLFFVTSDAFQEQVLCPWFWTSLSGFSRHSFKTPMWKTDLYWMKMTHRFNRYCIGIMRLLLFPQSLSKRTQLFRIYWNESAPSCVLSAAGAWMDIEWKRGRAVRIITDIGGWAELHMCIKSYQLVPVGDRRV